MNSFVRAVSIVELCCVELRATDRQERVSASSTKPSCLGDIDLLGVQIDRLTRGDCSSLFLQPQEQLDC